jgi:hypothetical protein
MFAASVVNHGFESCSGQTKDFKIDHLYTRSGTLNFILNFLRFVVMCLLTSWKRGHWFGVIWTHSSIFFSEIFTDESSECEPDKSKADIFDSGSDGSYIDDLDNDFVPTSDLDEIDVSLYSVYTQYYKVD